MTYYVVPSEVPGIFVGHAPEVGVVSQGTSRVQALRAIIDAARLFVAHRAMQGRPVERGYHHTRSGPRVAVVDLPRCTRCGYRLTFRDAQDFSEAGWPCGHGVTPMPSGRDDRRERPPRRPLLSSARLRLSKLLRRWSDRLA